MRFILRTAARMVASTALVGTAAFVASAPAFAADVATSPNSQPAAASTQTPNVTVANTTQEAATAGYATGGRCGYTKRVTSGSWSLEMPWDSQGFNDTYKCYMAVGDYSAPSTKELQISLRDCNGHPNLAVDGQFGNATKQALTNTQREVHATADGKYGGSIASYMKWKWYTGSGYTCALIPRSWL